MDEEPITRQGEVKIKTGDTVYHRPSSETWTVAYADYERNELAWCGWPDGYAKIDDCDLVECSRQRDARRSRKVR